MESEMVDEQKRAEARQEGRKRASTLSRVVTVVLAVAISAGAVFLFMHWDEIQDTGKACTESGRCVTLAPGPSADVETAGQQ